MSPSYANAAAFRQALETRIRTVAEERGVQIQGVRLKVAIERLLARLFPCSDSRGSDPPWILKGGYAMELRFRPRARTTRDVDLTISDVVPPEALASKLVEVHERLMSAAAQDLGDFFEFTIPPARSELTAAPGGGGVFSVVAKVAGREFARFHIDIGFGDGVVGEMEALTGEDLLAFAGVAPARAVAIPKAQQFAEKIHAYTFQWTDRVNMRSRDLVDLVLLIERGGLDVPTARVAVIETFRRRARHEIPQELAAPPEQWRGEFAAMAAEVGISTRDIDAAIGVLRAYWEALRPFE